MEGDRQTNEKHNVLSFFRRYPDFSRDQHQQLASEVEEQPLNWALPAIRCKLKIRSEGQCVECVVTSTSQAEG